MTPDNLGNFIDDVARAMTDVNAPADLRSRVLTQIDVRATRRWPSIVWQLAAAGVIVTAVLVSRPWLTSGPESPVTVTRDIRTAPATTAALTETDSAAATAHAAPRTPAMSADELAWLARAVPPLVTQDVVIPAIQPVPVSIAPIAVDPIELDPISMPPVSGGTVERR